MAHIDTTYLVLFSANLAFIVTHIYGWLLKWFYRPKAYAEHFHELFPAQKSVGVIYLLQVFEIPYLLQIGNSDALLYVNAFSLLFFSIQMLIMCEGYFFPNENAEHRKRTHLLLLFYDMISQHRVRYAISLIHQHPDCRLADIAEQCGFSSQASVTKAFKAQGKGTPSSNR